MVFRYLKDKANRHGMKYLAFVVTEGHKNHYVCFSTKVIGLSSEKSIGL